jgi:hypothetical protein
MRVIYLIVLELVLIFAFSACATGSSQSIKSSYQPIPAEERANKAMFDLTSNLNLSLEQKKSFQQVFINFYHRADALRQAGTPPDKNEIDMIWSQRDAALQKIMTAEQFKGFKEAERAYQKKDAESRHIPAEERANKAMFDLTPRLNLSPEQKKSFQQVFTSYYRTMDALFQPGISPDKNEVEKALLNRNAELQKIMTAEQFKGFKEAEDAYLKKRAEMRKMQ